LRAIVLLLAATLLAAAPAQAQSTSEMQAHFGELTYRLFCSGCHGADARGNGELAEALGIPLGDLTQLAKRNGGVFPADAVRDAIAGRGPLGHTKLNMAPWAQMFADEFEQFASRMAVNAMVARRIEHIVAYLESIQER
jgi:hypothetical protein